MVGAWVWFGDGGFWTERRPRGDGVEIGWLLRKRVGGREDVDFVSLWIIVAFGDTSLSSELLLGFQHEEEDIVLRPVALIYVPSLSILITPCDSILSHKDQ